MLTITGCALTSHTPTPPSVNTVPASVVYQGRFSVHYEDARGQMQNVYGHFVWREIGTALTLQLLNPLGQVLAMLEATPSAATLKLPKRAPQTASNLEDLMQQILGFALPIRHLQTWLQPALSSAQPGPATLQKTYHFPTQFKQDGWTVNYTAAPNQQATPSHLQIRHINLSREDPPTQIKLVLDP